MSHAGSIGFDITSVTLLITESGALFYPRERSGGGGWGAGLPLVRFSRKSYSRNTSSITRTINTPGTGRRVSRARFSFVMNELYQSEMTGSLTNGRVDCLQITGRSHGWTTDNPAVLIPERELTVQRNHSHTDS